MSTLHNLEMHVMDRPWPWRGLLWQLDRLQTWLGVFVPSRGVDVV